MQEASDEGFPKAQTYVGRGAFLNKEYSKAKKLLTMAAKEVPEAQYWLGTMYESGLGLPKNYQEAIRLFKIAAAKDNLRAQLSLNFRHIPTEVTGEKQQQSELVKNMMKPVHHSEHAQYNAAYLRLQKADSDKKRGFYFEHLAENVKNSLEKNFDKGHYASAVLLYQIYWKGDIVNKNKELAVSRIEKAAYADIAVAQLILSSHYNNGEHIEKDVDKALYWLKRAAENGNEVAIDKVKKLEEVIGTKHHE